MRNVPGDKAKQPLECKEDTSCRNLQETSSTTDMDGETYNCIVCGLRYRLYYEDMA